MTPSSSSATRSKTLKRVRAVIIPDMHQDVRWVERILAKEARPGTTFVFLGDYFHTKTDRASSIGETCALLTALLDMPDLVLLAGNHDLPYWECRRVVLRRSVPRHLNHWCSGFTPSKAKQIHKNLPDEFWDRLELFKVVNGWLVSHAGLAPDLWPSARTAEAAVKRLAAQERKAIKKLRVKVHPLLAAGRSRGGTAKVGGLTWCNYLSEWPREKRGVPMPTLMRQIFGHVSSRGARPVGTSWCLDGRQTAYGVMSRSGRLKVRTV